MGRLPFDPAKMSAANPPNPAAPKPLQAATGTLRVAQVAALLESALRDHVPRGLRVVGEISNFTERTHWYFNLKDADAVVSCVMFQFAARKAGFTPSTGQEVVVTGNVEFYKPQGKVTFRVEKIEPVGAGALELAYRKLVEEIRQLGWMDIARKRRLPAFPRRIAVVTSRTGAALQDVLDTLKRRCPAVEVCLLDTLVQGAAAAPAIATAINWLSTNARALGIDTLIVTRGGGSMEDLWAFNDRAVAEAIVNCSIPVAAAIGHETDTTIAELVADERCATPTQAAMRCSPDRAALTEQLEATATRLNQSLRVESRRARERYTSAGRGLFSAARTAVFVAARRLESLAGRLEAHRPSAIYERRRARVDQSADRLAIALRRRLDKFDLDRLSLDLQLAASTALRSATDRAAAAQRQLELVGPRSVLDRGYSVTLRPDGRAVRTPADVQPGDQLITRLADGAIESTVRDNSTRPDSALDPSLPVAAPIPRPTPMPPALPPRARPPRRARHSDSGPGLFG